MSVTNSMCLSQKICVCHSVFVAVKVSLCLPKTICFRQRQSSSYTESLYLSQRGYVCHRPLLFFTKYLFLSEKNMSVTVSLCLSQTVSHSQSVSFPVSLFLSQSPCVCPRYIVIFCHEKFFLSVTLCLYQTFFLIILGMSFTF